MVLDVIPVKSLLCLWSLALFAHLLDWLNILYFDNNVFVECLIRLRDIAYYLEETWVYGEDQLRTFTFFVLLLINYRELLLMPLHK